jgi:hypothetical protein
MKAIQQHRPCDPKPPLTPGSRVVNESRGFLVGTVTSEQTVVAGDRRAIIRVSYHRGAVAWDHVRDLGLAS